MDNPEKLALHELARRKTTREPVRGLIQARVKGGLIIDICLETPGTQSPTFWIEAFLPDSEAEDVLLSSDPEALVGDTHDFAVMNVDWTKEDVYVSRKLLLRQRQRALAMKHLRTGTVVGGEVAKVMDYGVLVDIGGVNGLLPVSEIPFGVFGQLTEHFEPGMQFDTVILSIDPVRQRIGLAPPQPLPDIWEQIRSSIMLSQREAEQRRLEFLKRLKVAEVVPGVVAIVKDYGVFVDLGDAYGLLPVGNIPFGELGQLYEHFTPGMQLDTAILRIDLELQRVTLAPPQPLPDTWEQVVSKITLERREAEEQRAGIFESLTVGAVRKGRVTNVQDIGVFVDFGGVYGLLPASKIPLGGASLLPEHFKPGMQLDTVISAVYPELHGIRLALPKPLPNTCDRLELRKREPEQLRTKTFAALPPPLPDTWGQIVRQQQDEDKQNDEEQRLEFFDRLQVGRVVQGTVRNVKDYGVFVTLLRDVYGLLHVSEIPFGQFGQLSEHFKPGMQLDIMVISLDQESQRIGLALPRPLSDQWREIPVPAIRNLQRPQESWPNSSRSSSDTAVSLKILSARFCIKKDPLLALHAEVAPGELQEWEQPLGPEIADRLVRHLSEYEPAARGTNATQDGREYSAFLVSLQTLSRRFGVKQEALLKLHAGVAPDRLQEWEQPLSPEIADRLVRYLSEREATWHGTALHRNTQASSDPRESLWTLSSRFGIPKGVLLALYAEVAPDKHHDWDQPLDLEVESLLVRRLRESDFSGIADLHRTLIRGAANSATDDDE